MLLYIYLIGIAFSGYFFYNYEKRNQFNDLPLIVLSTLLWPLIGMIAIIVYILTFLKIKIK
jgi:hypothetical protein